MTAGPSGQRVLETAAAYIGLPYVLGAEADLTGAVSPSALDCSELVQLACQLCGIPAPDGHWVQWAWCRDAGLLISVEQAIATPGALLFVYDGSTEGHVAFSDGAGYTVEARGRAYGVGRWSARHRGFTHGGLIPGVDYTGGGEWDMDEAQMRKFADLIAESIVTRLMAHTIELEDGKPYPVENILGFFNNIGNALVRKP